ncbi:MAG: sodium/solute symporter [Planctomycetota bacterium]
MNSICLAEAVGSGIDYAIIIAYFIAILGFGTFFGRYSKSTKDFFFGGSKFSWWLIAMSMVATGVGSYSFIKYSAAGFTYGMSSGMSYMNDWFFIPFFMFGWLPIIYFARVRSIPEYFQRRFNTPARVMAVIIILAYMLGYIGFNLYTLGVAAKAVLGVDVTLAMFVIAFVSAIYITVGGQTAVIFTDLIQGFMLLAAGAVVFVLGLDYLGADGGLVEGLKTFWANLGFHERLPFARFNRPPDFNFVGVFWQDGVASSITFLFINQGLIMRFLAAKSMTEGRKTILFNTLFLLPLSMIAVGSAGWIGNVMASMGLIDPATKPKEVFVVVTELICKPGVFGFVLAALTAALMSTIDTLINAVAAVTVYDVYQPFIAKGRSDRHYLKVARWVSIVGMALGLAIAFIFTNFDSIYAAHAAFISAVTPPIVVSVFLGAFWKRYTPAAAFWSMFGGATLIVLSIPYPKMIWPFGTWLHGVDPEGGYKFMRAFFGIMVSGVVGVLASFFTRPKPVAEIAGLWIGSIDLGRKMFKGAAPNHEQGSKILASLRVSAEGTSGPTTALSVDQIQPTEATLADTSQVLDYAPVPMTQPPSEYCIVRFSGADMRRMKAQEGDLLYVADARRWLGGLRSSHCRAGHPHDEGNVVLMAAEAFEAGSFLPDRKVRVEKFF